MERVHRRFIGYGLRALQVLNPPELPTGSAQDCDVERLAEFDIGNGKSIDVIIGVGPGFMIGGLLQDKTRAAEGFFAHFHDQINQIAGLRAAIAEACYPVLQAQVVIFEGVGTMEYSGVHW